MKLPGIPIEPFRTHPRLRRMGYELRESVDGDTVYVVYGHDPEEVVATMDAKDVTVVLLDGIINADTQERLLHAAPLNREWGFTR